MNRTILATVIIVLAAATGFFAYRWRNAETHLQQTVAYTHGIMDSLSTTVKFPPLPVYAGHDSLYWKWAAVNAQMNMQRFGKVIREQAQLRQTMLDQPDIEALKKEGLKDPPAELRASLMASADLIPFPGVLGGTMAFDEPFIVLLDSPFVFASFEDGHVAGNMLLSYRIADGKIEWKRLWAELE